MKYKYEVYHGFDTTIMTQFYMIVYIVKYTLGKWKKYVTY